MRNRLRASDRRYHLHTDTLVPARAAGVLKDRARPIWSSGRGAGLDRPLRLGGYPGHRHRAALGHPQDALHRAGS